MSFILGAQTCAAFKSLIKVKMQESHNTSGNLGEPGLFNSKCQHMTLLSAVLRQIRTRLPERKIQREGEEKRFQKYHFRKLDAHGKLF